MADELYLVEILLRARDEASQKIAALQRQVEQFRASAAGERITSDLGRGFDDLGTSVSGASSEVEALRAQHEHVRRQAPQVQRALRDQQQAHQDTAAAVSGHADSHSDLTRTSAAAGQSIDELANKARRGAQAFTEAQVESSSLANAEKELRQRSDELARSQEVLYERFRTGRIGVSDFGSELRRLQTELQKTASHTDIGSNLGVDLARRARQVASDARQYKVQGVGQEVLTSYQEYSRRVREGETSTKGASIVFRDFEGELRHAALGLRAGSEEAKAFGRAADEAGRKAKNMNLAKVDPGSFLGRAMTAVDGFGLKIVSLSAQLRGLILAGAIGFAQQLDTALVGLGGALVAVGSAAAQAGAAIGGALVSGLAQAIPGAVALLGVMDRVKSVLQAANLAQTIQQQGFTDPTKVAQGQIAATDAIKSAQNGLITAYQNVHNAQINVIDSQMRLTIARRDAQRQITDLGIAEQEAALKAAGANISLVDAQRALQLAIQRGDTGGLSAAQLGVDQAQLGVRRAQIDLPRARADAARARQLGVGGSEQVRQAGLAVTQATQQEAAAQRAIAQSQRQLQLAQMRAAAPATQVGSSQAQLAFLQSQMTGAEKSLFNSVVRIQSILQDPKSPFRRAIDYIVKPIADAAHQLSTLMGSGAIIGPFTILTKAIGRGLGDIERVLFSSRVLHFFTEMMRDGAKNVPILVSIFEHLMNLFMDVAHAAAPVLQRLNTDWNNFWGALDNKTSTPQGISKLQTFFEKGAKYAEDFGKLAVAFVRLAFAIGGQAAPAGDNIVTRLTSAMNRATQWVQSNGPEVRRFFDGVTAVVAELGHVLLSIGGAMLKLFDPGSVKALGDFLSVIVIPALTDALRLLGAMTEALLTFINLIPGGKKILEWGVGIVAVTVLLTKMYSPINTALLGIERMGMAIRSLIVGDGILASWDVLRGKVKAARDAEAGLAIANEAQNVTAGSGGITAIPTRFKGFFKGAPVAAEGVGAGAAVIPGLEGGGAATLGGTAGGAGGLVAAVGGAGPALAILAGVIVTVSGAVLALKDNFLGVTTVLRTWANWIASTFTDAWRQAGRAIDSVFGSGTFRAILNTIGDALSRLWSVIKGIAPDILKLIGVGALGGLAIIFAPLILLVSAFTAGVWALSHAFSIVVAGGAAIIGFFSDLGSTIKNAVVGAFNEVVGFMQNLPGQLGTLATTAAGALANGFKDVGNLILNSIQQGAGTVTDFGKGLINWIFDQVSNGINSLNVPLLPSIHIPHLAQGAMVDNQAGGRVIRVAEAGYPEAVITTDPRHASRQQTILTELYKQAPHLIPSFATGGMVGATGAQAVLDEAIKLSSRHYPYAWGGGHAGFFPGPDQHGINSGVGYDCSGAVSKVLHDVGLLNGGPLVSGQFESWGRAGTGPVTVYATAGHAFLRALGRTFTTSVNNPRHGFGETAHTTSGFVARVPTNLSLAHFGGAVTPSGAGISTVLSTPTVTKQGVIGAKAQAAIDETTNAIAAYMLGIGGGAAGKIKSFLRSVTTGGTGGSTSSSGSSSGSSGRAPRTNANEKAWRVRVSSEDASSGVGWTELSTNGYGAARSGHRQTATSTGGWDFATLGRMYPKGTKLKIRSGGRSGVFPLTDFGNGSSFAPAIGLTPAVQSALGGMPSTVDIELANGGNIALASGFGQAIPAFAQGGELPGHQGLAQWIIAHGKEWILNPEQQAKVAAWLGVGREKLRSMLGFTGGPQKFQGGGEPTFQPRFPGISIPPPAAPPVVVNPGTNPDQQNVSRYPHVAAMSPTSKQKLIREWQSFYRLTTAPSDAQLETFITSGAKHQADLVAAVTPHHRAPHHATTTPSAPSGSLGSTGSVGPSTTTTATTPVAAPHTTITTAQLLSNVVFTSLTGINDVLKSIINGFKSLDKNVKTKGSTFVRDFGAFITELTRTDGWLDSLKNTFDKIHANLAHRLTGQRFGFSGNDVVSQLDPNQLAAGTLSNLHEERGNISSQESIVATAMRSVKKRIQEANKIKDPKQRTAALQMLVTAYDALTKRQRELFDQMDQNTADIYSGEQAKIQAQHDMLTSNYQTSLQHNVTTPQSQAQALGNFWALPAIDQAAAGMAQTQIGALKPLLEHYRQIGDTVNANSIQQEMDQLQVTVVQSIVSMIQDGISAIQQYQGVQESFATLFGAQAQVAQSRGDFGGMKSNLAGQYQTRINTDQTALYFYRGLLETARATGDLGAVASLTQTINQLTGDLATNTQALEDNTFAVDGAAASFMQARGQFVTGVYSGLAQIVQTMGHITGSTDVATLRGLLGLSNNSLQGTQSGLMGILSSDYGINLTGQSGAQLVNSLSALPLAQIESGHSQQWISTFENLIGAIITNESAIQSNTQQLATLNGQLMQPQSWSTSSWSAFRAAVFNGMGGLLPQFAGVLPPGSMPTIAPVFGSTGGSAPTIGELNINHAPTPNFDPSTLGAQLAHEVAHAMPS